MLYNIDTAKTKTLSGQSKDLIEKSLSFGSTIEEFKHTRKRRVLRRKSDCRHESFEQPRLSKIPTNQRKTKFVTERLLKLFDEYISLNADFRNKNNIFKLLNEVSSSLLEKKIMFLDVKSQEDIDLKSGAKNFGHGAFVDRGDSAVIAAASPRPVDYHISGDEDRIRVMINTGSSKVVITKD